MPRLAGFRSCGNNQPAAFELERVSEWRGWMRTVAVRNLTQELSSLGISRQEPHPSQAEFSDAHYPSLTFAVSRNLR